MRGSELVSHYKEACDLGLGRSQLHSVYLHHYMRTDAVRLLLHEAFFLVMIFKSYRQVFSLAKIDYLMAVGVSVGVSARNRINAAHRSEFLIHVPDVECILFLIGTKRAFCVGRGGTVFSEFCAVRSLTISRRP